MPDILRAIILMILAMFFFTLADLFVKLASFTLTPGVIVFFMGAGTAVFFYAALRLQGQQAFQRSYLHWTVMMRNLGEVGAALGMIISLSYVPLSTVTAILQSQPLLLTAVGGLFLGERVGIRRALAVLCGFIGVMIILQPGADSFSATSLLVLIAVAGMTIRDVGSRLLPANIPTLSIALSGAVLIAISGLAIIILFERFVWPSNSALFYVVAMSVTASIGVYCITNAMRLGELSSVSPFRFIKIVFGVGAGVLILGEQLTMTVVTGSVIVTAAGLYAFMRERRLINEQRQTAPSSD